MWKIRQRIYHQLSLADIRMLQILTCLNNFIRNCFLLVLCSIPLFCSISFSFKRLGNYCNSENRRDKAFWHEKVGEKTETLFQALFLLHHQNPFISAHSPQTITGYKSTYKYTELHAMVNHEIGLSQSFKCHRFSKVLQPDVTHQQCCMQLLFLRLCCCSKKQKAVLAIFQKIDEATKFYIPPI